jgi:hypothetical protein
MKGYKETEIWEQVKSEEVLFSVENGQTSSGQIYYIRLQRYWDECSKSYGEWTLLEKDRPEFMTEEYLRNTIKILDYLNKNGTNKISKD